MKQESKNGRGSKKLKKREIFRDGDKEIELNIAI